MSHAAHLNLDDAWLEAPAPMPELDARSWGPRLRFSSPSRVVEQFSEEVVPQLAPFVLFGSGDFHHLSALLVRRVARPVTVISFDNHPDWDIRPPKWACGGWVNRALELPNVRSVSVWGCGNFECWWPWSLFGNRRAQMKGRLHVHAWADDRPASDQSRPIAILRENWRRRFEDFASGLNGSDVYVTIDLDCLLADEAVTNWESGRFSIADLEWALSKLQESCRIAAGDICGAYSPPHYARFTQRLAASFDHPRLELQEETEIRRINSAAVQRLWPILARAPSVSVPQHQP